MSVLSGGGAQLLREEVPRWDAAEDLADPVASGVPEALGGEVRS